MIEVRTRLNEKAHKLLKQECAKQGIPMSTKIRYYVYKCLTEDLRRRKEKENAINQKTK